MYSIISWIKPKTTRTIRFQTELSPDNAFKILNSYFDKTTKSINKYPKTSGYFLSNSEFEMRSKWEMTFYRNGYKRESILWGQIVPTANNQSKIFIIQNLSYGFNWYQLLIYLVPLFLIAKSIINKEPQSQLIPGIFLIILISVAWRFTFYKANNTVISCLKRELRLK